MIQFAKPNSYGNLVSDNLPSESWLSNQGATLPGRADATYNIGLSPFFIARGGNITNLTAIYPRGQNGYIYATTNKTSSWAFFLAVNNDVMVVQPSNYQTRTYTNSLRCLVSTTNS